MASMGGRRLGIWKNADELFLWVVLPAILRVSFSRLALRVNHTRSASTED
jgi:hypothetical protein